MPIDERSTADGAAPDPAPRESRPTTHPATSPAPTDAGANRSLTIVVAEDEPAIRLVLANKLKQAGYSVHCAANGSEGLALAQKVLPDLIITDYQMPRMDGLAMARALHQSGATKHIPLIVLSARGHRLGGADLAETSVEHVLLKPFSMREVIALVADLLGPGFGGAHAAGESSGDSSGEARGVAA